MIVAHRGAMCEAPENTCSSLKAALSYPIDGIEFDVQMTLDGVPVIFHDKTIIKISGFRDRIAEQSYDQLSRYDWGLWYSENYMGEPLLTLENALKLFGTKSCLMIEIKSDYREQSSGRSDILTSKVLELVKTHIPDKFMDNIYILSFDSDILEFAYSKEPGLKYVFNYPKTIQPSWRKVNCPNFLYGCCDSIKRLTTDFVEYYHTQGYSVMTYSCNIPKYVNKAMELSVDVIMTDRPGWIVDYLKQVDMNI